MYLNENGRWTHSYSYMSSCYHDGMLVATISNARAVFVHDSALLVVTVLYDRRFLRLKRLADPQSFLWCDITSREHIQIPDNNKNVAGNGKQGHLQLCLLRGRLPVVMRQKL